MLHEISMRTYLVIAAVLVAVVLIIRALRKFANNVVDEGDRNAPF